MRFEDINWPVVANHKSPFVRQLVMAYGRKGHEDSDILTRMQRGFPELFGACESRFPLTVEQLRFAYELSLDEGGSRSEMDAFKYWGLPVMTLGFEEGAGILPPVPEAWKEYLPFTYDEENGNEGLYSPLYDPEERKFIRLPATEAYGEHILLLQLSDYGAATIYVTSTDHLTI